jgi:hypothetical protein
MTALRTIGRLLSIGSALAMFVGCSSGAPPQPTASPTPVVETVEPPSASPTAPATAPAASSGPVAVGTPSTGDGMTHTPAGFTVDLALPPAFQWAWDDASYRAILDGLDPARRTAVEAVGPPMTKLWLDVYAVDTTSTPLPSGSLTMLYTMSATSQWASIDELEAAGHAMAIPAGVELVGLERLDAPAGPMLRGVFLMPCDVSQDTSVLATREGTEQVGMVQYLFLSAGQFGPNLDTFAFIIPADGIDSQVPALDEIMTSLRMRPDPAAPATEPGTSSTP